MLNLSKTFEKYEALVVEIDKIFKGMQGSHKDCMRCEIHCSDCCHAVFDLTLVEAVYISHHFNKSLSEKEREPILERAETAVGTGGNSGSQVLSDQEEASKDVHRSRKTSRRGLFGIVSVAGPLSSSKRGKSV